MKQPSLTIPRPRPTVNVKMAKCESCGCLYAPAEDDEATGDTCGDCYRRAFAIVGHLAPASAPRRLAPPPGPLKAQIKALQSQARAAFNDADFVKFEVLTEAAEVLIYAADRKLQGWFDARPSRRTEFAAIRAEYRARFPYVAPQGLLAPRGGNV